MLGREFSSEIGRPKYERRRVSGRHFARDRPQTNPRPAVEDISWACFGKLIIGYAGAPDPSIGRASGRQHLKASASVNFATRPASLGRLADDRTLLRPVG